jgi:hypothetical protein
MVRLRRLSGGATRDESGGTTAGTTGGDGGRAAGARAVSALAACSSVPPVNGLSPARPGAPLDVPA